jgi:hypothetical protein
MREAVMHPLFIHQMAKAQIADARRQARRYARGRRVPRRLR